MSQYFICAGFVYFTIVYVTYIYPSTDDYKIRLPDCFYTIRLLFDIMYHPVVGFTLPEV